MSQIATDRHTLGQRDTLVSVKGNLLLAIERGEFRLLGLAGPGADCVVPVFQTQFFANPNGPETAWRANAPDLSHVALLRPAAATVSFF